MSKTRLKIAAVAFIFIAPLATAWLLYGVFPEWVPAERTHEGELTDPVKQLPGDGLRPVGENGGGAVFGEQWTMLQVAPGDCGDACRAGLATTRQVRAVLHRRAPRVRRVLVVDGALPENLGQHPDLAVYRGAAALRPVLGERPAGTVYLVDPLGNWMLTYPAPADADALFEDIKHLMKLSQIG